ncbi:MAG: DUF4833 domain-containing protein [Bacteroidota bacterium]|nr:DUF4833 domain-containing protein [Bacteroidota bacterium]
MNLAFPVLLLVLNLMGYLSRQMYFIDDLKKTTKQNITKTNTYKSDRLLFYIGKSTNKNIVAYYINLLPDGRINSDEPIHPCWKLYQKGQEGAESELSFLQRKFAYGIECKSIDKQNNNYVAKLVCYKRKNIYLKKLNKESNYKAYIEINSQLAVLNKIFITIDGGSLLCPNITKIEISGQNVTSGLEVSEIIIP